MRTASAGHAVFAATMIGLGALGLIQRDFAPIWQPVPKGMPGRAVLIVLCAVIPLVSGVGLLIRPAAAGAARLLLAFLLLWLLLLRVPRMFISFTVDSWWAACQTAVMVAAAWVLYAWFAMAWDRDRLRFAAGARRPPRRPQPPCRGMPPAAPGDRGHRGDGGSPRSGTGREPSRLPPRAGSLAAKQSL